MFRKSIALLVSTSMLGACAAGFRGPSPVLNSSGIVQQDARQQQRYGIFFHRFRALAFRVAGCDIPESDQAQLVCRPDFEPEPALLRRYMRAGFALINTDCNEYMSAMARNQGRSRVARDLIGPISALITGIISLRNLSDGDEQDWLTRLSLGSAVSTAALNIVDQRFLFGADNIDAVRGRVIRALGEQADQALSRPDAELNFERASIEILNSQATCTPSGILSLTHNAIETAPVSASNSATDNKQNNTESEGMSGTSVDPQ
jgi:hypothetical protein